jgi:hypothetical protein
MTEEVFCIRDSISTKTMDAAGYFLSILSPSCAINWKTAVDYRYAPPFARDSLKDLASVSTRYPLSDAEISNPEDTGGSLESRMGICGGILRNLNSDATLKDLENSLAKAVSKLKIRKMPEHYFSSKEPTSDKERVVHRIFACFPTAPFTAPGNICFVSSFVESLVMQHFSKLAEERSAEREQIEAYFSRILGLPMLLKGGSRGTVFEGVCHTRIAWSESGIMAHHFETALWAPPSDRDANWPIVNYIDIPALRRTEGDAGVIPRAVGMNWFWVPNSPTFCAIDGILCIDQTIYLLQMTVDRNHKMVTLTDIWTDIQHFFNIPNLEIKFLVVVDCMDTLKAFLRKQDQLLLVREREWANMEQLVALIAPGRGHNMPVAILRDPSEHAITQGVPVSMNP